MTFEEAKVLARQGIKMTHEYFTSTEYMTMQGNMIVFEDGVKIFADEWSKGKDYLLNGWERFRETNDDCNSVTKLNTNTSTGYISKLPIRR